jgi:hypothetical protein
VDQPQPKSGDSTGGATEPHHNIVCREVKATWDDNDDNDDHSARGPPA